MHELNMEPVSGGDGAKGHPRKGLKGAKLLLLLMSKGLPLRGASQGPRFGGQHWLIGTSEGVFLSGVRKPQDLIS